MRFHGTRRAYLGCEGEQSRKSRLGAGEIWPLVRSSVWIVSSLVEHVELNSVRKLWSALVRSRCVLVIVTTYGAN